MGILICKMMGCPLLERSSLCSVKSEQSICLEKAQRQLSNARHFGIAWRDCFCLCTRGGGLEMERCWLAWAPLSATHEFVQRCYLCWRMSRHQTTADEMQKCCWPWQIPLFPSLLILRCQDKQQWYEVLEGMKGVLAVWWRLSLI